MPNRSSRNRKSNKLILSLHELIFFSAKEDKIQSIDCGTESSNYYKKLNESV